MGPSSNLCTWPAPMLRRSWPSSADSIWPRPSIEHRDGICAVFGKPQTVLRVDHASARPGISRRRGINLELFRLRIDQADIVSREIEQIEIVFMVRWDAVRIDVAARAVYRKRA